MCSCVFIHTHILISKSIDLLLLQCCSFLYSSILILLARCPLCAVKEILNLCPAETLVSIYKIPSFNSADEFLQNVATARGKLKKGGIIDVDAAARIVLHDWNEGISYL